MKPLIATLLASAAVLSSTARFAAADGVEYTLTDLGSLGGIVSNTSGDLFTYSVATGINNSGQVVGESVAPNGQFNAFLYSGQMTDLGTLPGYDSSDALAINDSGNVVGQSGYGAFVWNAQSGMQQLFNPTSSASANGINNSNLITGNQYESDAFVYTAATGRQSIGNLSGDGGFSASTGVNSLGQVVGSTPGPNSFDHAFLWSAANGMRDLGSLSQYASYGLAVNSSGEVVGNYDLENGTHAFVWDSVNGMRDLGTLSPSTSSSTANAINDLGQMVGQASYKAVLWEPNLTILDLNQVIDPSLGWNLMSAVGINNLGQIVGNGIDPNGDTHAFLLTPIPEPSSLALFGVGASGVCLAAVRRRHVTSKNFSSKR